MDQRKSARKFYGRKQVFANLSYAVAWVLIFNLVVSPTVLLAETDMPTPANSPGLEQKYEQTYEQYRKLEKHLVDDVLPKLEKLTSEQKHSTEAQSLAGEADRLHAELHELGLQLSAVPVEFSIPVETSTEKQADSISVPGTLEIAKDLNANQKDREAEKQMTLLGHAGHAALSFSSQYLTYSIATGIIAASNLVEADPADPMWLENWEKQTFSAMGAVGFAFFIAGDQATVRLLNLLRGGRIPRSLTTFIGMSFGFMAQNLVQGLWVDKNIQQCFRPNAKTPDLDACAKARSAWLDSGKILDYAPEILHMFGSSLVASAIHSKLLSGLSSERDLIKSLTENGGKEEIHAVHRGLELIPRAEWLKNAALHTKGVAIRFGGALANFVGFLLIDAKVSEPVVSYVWQDLKANYIDINAIKNKNWAMHSEFFYPKSTQPIANAFEVEATTPYSAHNLLMDFYRSMQATNWKAPAAESSCVPADIAAVQKAHPDELKNLQNDWIWNRWITGFTRAKSETQLRCEVFANPQKLLESYGNVNHEWRGTLLSRFSSSEANWSNMMSDFSTSYAASYQLANYLANAKNAELTKNAPAPDLSREAVAKVISASGGAESTFRPSWFLDGTWVPTPELVDYVAAGSACGSELTLNPNASQGDPVSRVFSGMYTFFARQISSPNFVSTPYGSSLRFVPPKLTTLDREICARVPHSTHYLLSDWLPLSIAPENEITNPFTGQFVDNNGTSYPSLVSYTYANLNPEIYQKNGYITNFSAWWGQHFDRALAPVWQRYDKMYQEFLKNQYVPTLFERGFRYGCKAGANANSTVNASKQTDETGLIQATTGPRSQEVACTDDSNAYRVANGVFLAIETELRNYLRGLYSLDISSLPKNSKEADVKKAKGDFVALSNLLIEDVRTVRAEDLEASQFEARMTAATERVQKLADLLRAQLNSQSPGSDPADAKFRLAMLAKFIERINGLISEEKGYAKTFHLMQHAFVSLANAKATTPAAAGSGAGANPTPGASAGSQAGSGFTGF